MITSIRYVRHTLGAGGQLSFHRRPTRAGGQEADCDFSLKSEKISESFQQMKATHPTGLAAGS